MMSVSGVLEFAVDTLTSPAAAVDLARLVVDSFGSDRSTLAHEEARGDREREDLQRDADVTATAEAYEPDPHGSVSALSMHAEFSDLIGSREAAGAPYGRIIRFGGDARNEGEAPPQYRAAA